MKKKLLLARLRQVLDYDPETGAFTRKVSKRTDRIGPCPGTPDTDGYLMIKVDGRLYGAHRLAFFFMRGRWPIRVDHEDGNKANNRWTNIRKATPAQNAWNQKRKCNNKSGFKGVVRVGRRYRASIRKYGKLIDLGRFDSGEEAHAAYRAAADRLFSKFARYQ